MSSPHGNLSQPLHFELVESLESVSPDDWDALIMGAPLLSHRFLQAFESSQSIGPGTGWTPRYGLLKDQDRLVGAVPLYLKSHSYGEYVFDWSWARALESAGHRYYPKLLNALPFTPVTGDRLLSPSPTIKAVLAEALRCLPEKLGVSSLHVLFPSASDRQALENAGFLIREGIQFHWHRAGVRSFDAFLERLSAVKRKKIRQERRKVREAGVQCEIKCGDDIQPEDWVFFDQCYRETYRAHHSSPYLSSAFFETLSRDFKDHVMLVIAKRDGRTIASALNFYDGTHLWGRHWGALEFVPGLHFEVCYYQGIEFCLARGLDTFEGGAQGEHKLARGFEPVRIYSAHVLRHPGLHDAVLQFLERESQGITQYQDELEAHAPFKRSSGS